MDLSQKSIDAVAVAGHTALYRRPRHERIVLGIIRGENRELPGLPDIPSSPGAPDSRQSEERQAYELPFLQLRKLSQDNGLQIQAPDCRYVSPDELQLLAWLALAQRYKSHNEAFHADERLTRSIFLCAGILTGLGTNLPPVTMLARANKPRGRAA